MPNREIEIATDLGADELRRMALDVSNHRASKRMFAIADELTATIVPRRHGSPGCLINHCATRAEYDAKRTLSTTQAGQQYDEAGQLVMTAR